MDPEEEEKDERKNSLYCYQHRSLAQHQVEFKEEI